MGNPINPPIRHRIALAIMYAAHWLLPNEEANYRCSACLREDHNHCESVNDRPSWCSCCSGGYHDHPHDPAEEWPHLGGR